MLNESEKNDFQHISVDMEDNEASCSLKTLSNYLSRYYHKKVIILLDEYDTPMQEAYINGYWDELASFTRSLFNATFKTNPYLERAVMTGITRVSKESIFSDLNNLSVVTTTSEKYADCFGFREEEVFAALDEYDLSERKQEVKAWYDGFTFGSKRDIYNPWSIINYLNTGKLGAYWANSSSNSLVGKLIREGSSEIKEQFEQLLLGHHLFAVLDEQIVYNQLDMDEEAVWSLLLASGYLKVVSCESYEEKSLLEYGSSNYAEGKENIEGEEECEGNDDLSEPEYELTITNLEVRRMFRAMIHSWFGREKSNYNAFIKALLLDDVKAMNIYMNRVALATFSYFDTGKNPSGEEPERFHAVEATTKSLTEPNSSVCFYHGFVLGLMAELVDRYVLTSNRESGFGRYDVMLEPRRAEDDGIIIEFKCRIWRKKKSFPIQ